MTPRNIPAKLPTVSILRKTATLARKRLKYLFQNERSVKKLPNAKAMYTLGLLRLKAKECFAIVFANHMKKNNIHTVEEFAHLHWIGEDYQEALKWLRSPTAFNSSGSKKAHDEYLLNLCGLEWDHMLRSFVPSSKE